MQDLARGWAIVSGHGHLADAIALLVALLIALAAGFWAATAAHRRRLAKGARLKPKPRAPLPGPDRGFRK